MLYLSYYNFLVMLHFQHKINCVLHSSEQIFRMSTRDQTMSWLQQRRIKAVLPSCCTFSFDVIQFSLLRVISIVHPVSGTNKET